MGAPSGIVSFRSPLRPLIAGEVLFDCFPDHKVLGGAPFNVAWNLRGLGSSPLLISAVGQDDSGLDVLDAMRRWNLDSSALQVLPPYATGRVDIELSGGEPSYRFWDDVAYDHIGYPELVAGEPNWSIFYHGSLALRGRESRHTILDLARSLDCPRFVDINLRPPHFDAALTEPILQDAAHVKLNLAELVELSGESPRQAEAQQAEAWEAPSLAASDPNQWESFRRLAERLRDRHGIGNLWITAGPAGSAWCGRGDAWVTVPASPVPRMLDTVGAGDAFAARVILGIAAETSPHELLRKASAFAARVCGIRGAISEDPQFYAETETA